MGLFDSIFGKSKRAPAPAMTPEDFDRSVWAVIGTLDQWSTPEDTKRLVHRILCYLYRHLDRMPRVLIQTRTAEEGRFLLSCWLRPQAGILTERLAKSDLRLAYAYATTDALAYVSDRRSELELATFFHRIDRFTDYWVLTAEEYRLPGYFLLADDLGVVRGMDTTKRAGDAVRRYRIEREDWRRKILNPDASEVVRAVLQSSAGFFGVFTGELPFSVEQLHSIRTDTVVSPRAGMESSAHA